MLDSVIDEAEKHWNEGWFEDPVLVLSSYLVMWVVRELNLQCRTDWSPKMKQRRSCKIRL